MHIILSFEFSFVLIRVNREMMDIQDLTDDRYFIQFLLSRLHDRRNTKDNKQTISENFDQFYFYLHSHFVLPA